MVGRDAHQAIRQNRLGGDSMLIDRRGQHRERGQALVETAIMMPVFLLGLFGTIWAVRESTLSERVQESVRYGGAVSLQHNPFESYSLFSLYNVLDGAPSPTGACAFDGGPALSSGRAFWLPTAGSTTENCTEYISRVGAVNDGVVLQNSIINVSAAAPEGGYLLGNAFNNRNYSVQASQNFFRSPDIGQLAACTPLGNAIKRSLEGGVNDGATTTNVPTPLPLRPVANQVVVEPLVCATFSPPTAGPTSTPPPSPTPTQTATQGGSPTPTPTATGTPTASPTPTKSPTPKPTPTGSPTAAPTPTPKSSPTMSPTPPVSTPKPSPSSVPTKTPKPRPTASPTPTPDPDATPPGSGQG